MLNNVGFSVSMMCMNFLNMKQELEIISKRADYMHIDIMDGHYCDNLTLSPLIMHAFAKVASIPMDVHFMCTDPAKWIPLAAEAGGKILMPHAETINASAFRTINFIKSFDCQAGVVLNPASQFSIIEHYVDRIDRVLIMTVDVGFAGQAFISAMLKKIEQAANFKVNKGLNYKIQVDGCCNNSTYKSLVNAGANILTLGTLGLFKRNDDLNIAFDQHEKDFLALTQN